LLIILAQNFQDSFGNLRISFINVWRLFAKNRQVRTLEGTVREFDVRIQNLKAPAIALRQAHQTDEYATHCFLVTHSRESFPGRNSVSYFQLNARLVGHLYELFECDGTLGGFGLHTLTTFRIVRLSFTIVL